MKRIAIIDAHPDPDPKRFGHALVSAYVHAAREAGHEVREIRLAGKDIPILQSRSQWMDEPIPADAIPIRLSPMTWVYRREPLKFTAPI